MTTTTGPIPLTVVTLYCRTAEAVCEHFRDLNTGPACAYPGQSVDFAFRGINSAYLAGGRVLTPDWCPLRPKEATNDA